MTRVPRRLRELGLYLYPALRSLPRPTTRFVLFAQGRTGTWLLYHLLNQHPQIRAEKEILRLPVMAPLRYLDSRSRLRRSDVYGCHVQIAQLLAVQQVDPERFLTRLHERGWRIIYLRRRDWLRQSISTMIAGQRQEWFSYRERSLANERFHIEPDELLDWLDRRAEHTRREGEILASLPHLALTYEDDLLHESAHGRTLARVWRFLGVPRSPVAVSTRRMSPGDLGEIVRNYDEVVAAVAASRFAHFVGG